MSRNRRTLTRREADRRREAVDAAWSLAGFAVIGSIFVVCWFAVSQ
jgi:hypothetical protein